jgi:elongation factor G
MPTVSAALQAMRTGLEHVAPVLLEPIFRLDVVVPAEYSGDLPLAEMVGYAKDLRSATQGRGVLCIELTHYAPHDPQTARRVLGPA